MNLQFLQNTNLFQGINDKELNSMLPCLHANTRQYRKNESIHRSGDNLHTLGLLLSGKISIENDDFWGNKMILGIITPGQIFAETYACIPGSELMVNVVAIENCEVLHLDISTLLSPCQNNCPYHNKLIRNLLTIMAGKNLNLSNRSFHTAPKTIRGRLLSYLSYEAKKQGSYEFDIPFNRQQLADYLNLDRSALSNELSKMAQDGILATSRNHFVIKQKDLNNT